MIPEPFTLERIPDDTDWTRHKGTDAPKILPPPGEVWRTPGGRKQTGRFYSRTTTIAKTLEDSFAIAQWRIGRVLVGIGQRPDYQLAAAALTLEDYDRAGREQLAERCIEASGSSAALIGTSLHTFTERVDRGEPVGYVPEAYRELVEAWSRITAPLRFEYREVRTVHDGIGAAGTPDAFGFCELPDPDGVVDERRVIDLKSGSIKYPATMSAQLYLYADGDLYDTETGERRPLEVNKRWGLIVHLKSDSSEPPGLYWINLEHGRRCVELAVPVREWRAVKPDAILVPALVEAVVPATPEAGAELADITEALKVTSERLIDEQADAALEALDRLDERLAVAAAPERCELSDLLVSECGCRVHRPDVQTTTDGELVEDGGPVDITSELEAAAPTAADVIARAVTSRDLELLVAGPAAASWDAEAHELAARRHAELAERERLERPRAALHNAIGGAGSPGTLAELWMRHGRGEVWTDEHTAAAEARHRELVEGAA